MNEQHTLVGDPGRQQKAHEMTIEALAKETHAEITQVRELYEAEHARLSAQARIKTYVTVLATRLVKSALQNTQHSLQ